MGRRSRMTPEQPKYIAIDRDRHGNERIYYRKPGQRKIRLRGPMLSREFWEDYHAAVAGKIKPARFHRSRATPAAGSFSALCAKYYQSTDFRTLSPTTQRRRRRLLDDLREKRGDAPANQLRKRHVYDIMDAAPARETANMILKSLRQLYAFGVARELVHDNPAADVPYKRLPKHLRGEGFHAWTDAECEAFEAFYPVGNMARLAYDLLVFTGQRRSDVVHLGRQHIENNRILLRQKKTGKRLEIPVHPALAESIRATNVGGELCFLQTDRGKPFASSNSFGNKMRKWCDAAGLKKCSAHGLRKVAAKRLSELGCTTHQIMAITGHDSPDEIERYTEQRNQVRLAEQAIEKYASSDFSRKKVPLSNELPYSGTIQANPLDKRLKINAKKESENDWCPHTDSNRGPTDYKSVALPAEL